MSRARLERARSFMRVGASPKDKAVIGMASLTMPLLRRFGVYPHMHVSVTAEGREVPIHVRGAYELLVVDEVFVSGDYAVEFLPDPKVIVDLGANIGASALYFRSRFPRSVIHAIEPNPPSLERLRQNAGSDAHTFVHPVAVSRDDGTLTLHVVDNKPASASFAKRDGASGGVDVATWSLPTLLDRVGEIDLMKFDVEGAEWDVFEGRDLSGIRELIGEVHDDLMPVSRDEFLSVFEATHEIVTCTALNERRAVLHLRRRA